MKLPQTARAARAPKTMRNWLLLLGVLGLVASGCQGPPAHQQRLVSRPTMLFRTSGVFQNDFRLLSQVEPGSVGSAASALSGCSACR